MFIFWCRSFSCNRLAVLIWKMVPKTTNKNTHYHLGYLYKKFLYLLLHTWKHLTFSLPPSNYSIVHTLRLACPEFCGKTSWLFWKGWCHQGDQASSFCVWVKLPRLARVPLKRLRVGPQESSLVQLPIVPGHRCHADTCSCGQTGSALSWNSGFASCAQRWHAQQLWRVAVTNMHSLGNTLKLPRPVFITKIVKTRKSFVCFFLWSTLYWECCVKTHFDIMSKRRL